MARDGDRIPDERPVAADVAPQPGMHLHTRDAVLEGIRTVTLGGNDHASALVDVAALAIDRDHGHAVLERVRGLEARLDGELARRVDEAVTTREAHRGKALGESRHVPVAPAVESRLDDHAS